MDRLFDRIWNGDIETPMLMDWAPAVDVSETADAVTIKMEIPGLDPKDVQVMLKDQVLTIRGEKKRETEKKDERFYRKERMYGSFVRTIPLPTFVDEHKVNATFHNGLLTVSLIKAAEEKGTPIPIKAS
jgi:HSP20 family protein